MGRQIPGGAGIYKGPDRRVSQSESQFTREAILPAEDGWILSPVGEAVFSHLDASGVSLTQDRLNLWYLPPRQGNMTVSHVRVSIASAVPSSSLVVALYRYADQAFTQIPNTQMTFDGTATGLLTAQLTKPVYIPKTMRVFLAVVGRGATPVVAGYGAGVGAISRVVRGRRITGALSPLRPVYPLAQFISDNASPCPLIAYLSAEANAVL